MKLDLPARVARVSAWIFCWLILFSTVALTELAVCMNGWNGPLAVFAASWGSMTLLGMTLLAHRRRPHPVRIVAGLLLLAAAMGAVAALAPRPAKRPWDPKWRAPSFETPWFGGMAAISTAGRRA